MPRRFVDLSIYLENDVLSDPPPLAPRITYQKHADTLPEFMAMIPGTKPEDYPDGEAAAAEWVTLTTHNGTHLDAPWHFHSTQDAKNGGSRPSITIDQVPLEWCFQNGVKLDFRHFPDGYVATAADVQAAIARAQKQLPLEMTTPPSYRKVNPADAPIILLALKSDLIPLSQLDAFAQQVISPALSTVDGVAQVQIYGSQKYADRIQVDGGRAVAVHCVQDGRPIEVQATREIVLAGGAVASISAVRRSPWW